MCIRDRYSRKRPSLLSLACASGRLSFAVGERYYCCVYLLSAISFHVRMYADASFHITIQARSTNTRFTYVQSSTTRRKKAEGASLRRKGNVNEEDKRSRIRFKLTTCKCQDLHSPEKQSGRRILIRVCIHASKRIRGPELGSN